MNDDFSWRNTPVENFYTEDFIDALRDYAEDIEEGKIPRTVSTAILRGAADTIERLNAEVRIIGR